MPDGVIGTTAGNYRLIERIGDGGMGMVYRAEHTLLGRPAAVKILHPELTHNREIVNRFFNEAKATTAIQHPGIVEVFDFGYLETGFAYIVMELLQGHTLAKRLKQRGTMPEGEAAALLRGVCSGLAAAHDKGIVHRDLKPDNLYLVEDLDVPGGERVKLLDFGIAKLTDLGSAHAATKTGAVMGTPTYMSPEQCRGSGGIDARADIYSLGCIFYQLLTGRPPFANEGAGEVIGMHLYMNPDPPSRYALGISADTEALVMAMLAKDPNARPQTARDLSQALGVIAAAHGWRSTSEARFSYDGSSSYTPAYVQPTTVSPPGQPTTLSGAASQSIITKRTPTKKHWIAIGTVVALIAIGVTFSVIYGGGDKQPAAQPAPAPTAQQATPAPPPTPAPLTKAPPQPTPVATPKPEPKRDDSKSVADTSKSTAKAKPDKPKQPKPDKPKPDKPDTDLPVETSVE